MEVTVELVSQPFHEPAGRRTDRIGVNTRVDAVELVLLIKQGRAKGLSLPAAIEHARRFKEAREGILPPQQ